MKKTSQFLRLAIVAALLATAAYAIDPIKLWQSLTPAMLLAVVPAALICLFGTVLLGARLTVLASPPRPALLVSWKAFILTGALNALIPGRVAELVKPVFLNEHAGVPLHTGFAALFLERVLDVAILFGLVLIAAGTAFVNLDWKFALAVFAGLLGLVAAIPFVETHLQRLGGVIPVPRVREFYADSLAHTAATVREGRIFAAFFFGCAGWATSIAGTYVYLLLASPVQIGFSGALSLFVATSCSYLIPALPAGVGVFEAAAVVVLQYYAIGREDALALGLVLHAGNIAATLLCGGSILIRDRIGVAAFIRRFTTRGKGRDKDCDSSPGVAGPPGDA